MSSFRTMFRAAVMVGVLVVVAKGWHVYGPSHEQMAALVVRAIEAGDGLLGRFRAPPRLASSDQVPVPPVDARSGAAPSVAGVSLPSAQRLPPTGLGATSASSAEPGAESSKSTPAATGDVILASAAVPSAPPRPASAEARLQAALSRLQQLGVGEHELQPWGASGQLYRFRCNAAWGGAPSYSRHFEAVAAEPLSAVQQVVDQVAAWRATDAGKLR